MIKTAPLREFAPAKLNLYLHITGRRADGYHDLDSLVAFATIGDELLLSPAEGFSFTIQGPQTAALAHEEEGDNLVVKAAQSLAELTGHSLDVSVILIKNLPVASGIGGGSSDAAALLRALARHWGLQADDPRLAQAAIRHGQDVPVCLRVENNYMTATGTMLAPRLPRAAVLLVNPCRGLSTPAVYKEFRDKNDMFSPPARLDQTPVTLEQLVEALKGRSNDLYAAACRLMPEIATIVEELKTSDRCLLARMSGSGATCFGIYKDRNSAATAAAVLRARHPGWWVEAGEINVF